MTSLTTLSLKGKKVLLRVDFNVPFDASGRITDDTRLRAHLPTLKHLISKEARIIIISHLGDKNASLKPVADALKTLIDTPVSFASHCIGEAAQTAANALENGDILLLENTRAHVGEKENDVKFAQELSLLADVYVNDAFAAAHRAHASTHAVTSFFKEKAFGLLMEKELSALTEILKKPRKPFAVIIGGSKISTKLNLLKSLIKKADHIFIGGAMANTFLVAEGHKAGTSLVEMNMLESAKDIIKEAEAEDCHLHFPRDVVTAKAISNDVHHSVHNVNTIPADQMALDVGPKTIEGWLTRLGDSETILWNGPVGAFEIDAFSDGTITLAKALARMGHTVRVLGGGDTLAALAKAEVPQEKLDLVSTGGGAMLEFLEGKSLPAVDAMQKN